MQTAIESFQSGDLQSAREICKKILKKEPDNIGALHVLGMVYYRLENYDRAIEYLTRALQFDPNSYEGHYNLGRVFQAKGEVDKAISCYQKVIQLNPAFSDAYINLGNALREAGRSDESIVCYQKIAGYDPTNAGVYFNLGVALQDKGRTDEAIASYQRAVELNVNIAGVFNNLGVAFQNRGEINDAIIHFQKALKIDSCFAEAHYNLANLLKGIGKIDDAIACYRRAIQCRPDYVDAYNNLGIAFKESGHIDEAIACYQRALQLNPQSAEAYNNFGIALYQKCQLEHAIFCFRKALSIKPDSAEAYNALGTVFKDKGQHDEAEKYLQLALQLNPLSSTAYSNLIFYMNYNLRHDAEAIFAEHLSFAERFAAARCRQVFPRAGDDCFTRRLRIGYVSPDFRRHSVAFFIEPVLISHDRERFEVFCYSDVLVRDEVTGRIQGLADQFRNIVGLSDEKVAELIRADEIDILVDLSGHTANNRMLLFARRPAPVQVSWIGYPATTGLATMDYKIVDRFTDPPGLTEQFYTEKLIRMPDCFLCYLPDRNSPEVSPLPALSSAHITFGSFNNLAKVTPIIIELWAKTLKAVERSRLILKAKSLSDRATRDYVLEQFANRGVDTERIELFPWEPSAAGHLGLYARVDVGLDTYPYNGTTTTCEALWMGVPVITLTGNTHGSRVGYSILSNVGLHEFAAKTPDEYVNIAVNLAGALNELSRLRENLRGMVARSPLTDAKGFVANLGDCYRAIWKKACA